MIRFSRNDAYQAKPLYEIFDPQLWDANYQGGAFFKNKIVLIGAASQIAHDVVATPMTPDMPGPVLHLQTMAAAIQHEFLRATPVALDYCLLGLAGIFSWSLVGFVRRPFICIASLAGVTAIYLMVARVARSGRSARVHDSGFGRIRLERTLFVRPRVHLERREKVRTRRTLERYVSKNLVKEILDNPGGYYSSLRGVRVPATILFSDMVGLTP